MRWTEADLAQFRRRMADPAVGYVTPKPDLERIVTIARRMNKTEAEYSEELQLRKLIGEIADWKFEAIKLRLADQTYYTPDFAALGLDDRITFHEVKGIWRDDARVKFKVAAEQFPWFEFVAVQKRKKRDGGGWLIETRQTPCSS